MIKILACLSLTCAFFFVGCQESSAEKQSAASVPAPAAPSAGEPGAASGLPEQLAHHNFVIETVDGTPFSDKNPDGSRRAKPHVSFGQWPEVNGKLCNSFRGQVTVSGQTLKMENAASTMMLCLNELNDLENIFHQMLRAGVEARVENRTLTLSGEGHVLVFSLFDYVQ